MQSSSSNFTQEISGGSVTWAQPKVFADWDRTGYGADGSIDDLSAQVGDEFTIEHHLDDGLPDAVSQVTGLGSPTLTTPLAYGRNGQRASTYFSPYNGGSPVSGFDRDVAPVKLEWGAVTSAGQEYVRLFTGQMGNIPVKGQGAELRAGSATREKLRTLVWPSGIEGAVAGLNATWPISYALAQSGVYASPPPRAGCRLWMPMHGSLMPMLPAQRPVAQNTFFGMGQRLPSNPLSSTIGRPTFVPGPFVLAAFGQAVAGIRNNAFASSIDLAPGTDLISKAGNKGRVEFWVRGDAANVNATPGGSGNITNLVDVYLPNDNGSHIRCGINKSRQGVITVSDGVSAFTVATPDTLPSDGAWYLFGCAWDFAAGTQSLKRMLSSTVDVYLPTVLVSNLPVADDFTTSIEAFLPIAEFHLTSGTDAVIANSPWINDPSYFTSNVILRPSILELEGLTETVPREAWELIGSFAQAELAMMRTDELDRFCYLPMPYWTEAGPQTVADALSTATNTSDLDINADPSLIRNAVSVSYTDTQVVTDTLYEVFDGLPTIGPRTTTVITVVWAKPATGVNSYALFGLDDTQLTTGSDPGATYFTANTDPDALGTYALGSAGSDITVQLSSWTPRGGTITVTNPTGSTWYFVNATNGAAVLSLGGQAVHTATAAAVARDATSIAKRGERGLTVSLDAIQRVSDAQAIANELAARLAIPRPIVGNVDLFPDPRRQPGDLVTLADAVNTGASGLWRIQSLAHNRSGNDYTQTATIRQALPVGHWDVDGWDNMTWGP